ncbi:hypothetical protein F2Q68_00043440 [Brassica cretica]|uniref:F-box protein At3g26010-like beta-propeller domain-containing protein n=2 Tax=Brassica cretica TaxID=69181 RepID=A0ABQ7APF7_BRACR|nr:hypothetical protein F2Q68_00043440 [Brassica cretica]KAF3515769.1 hypothetical protein DY000_02059079 [Brassica cretica]
MGFQVSSNFALLVLFRDLVLAGDNQCRIIPLPGPYNKYVRRCLTASCGDVIYVED